MQQAISISEGHMSPRNPNPFPEVTQQIQFYDKYSQWRSEDGRRETWEETVARVMGWFDRAIPQARPALGEDVWTELSDALYNLEALPSMRVMQMAGPALDRCHIGAYNCAFTTIDSWQSFGELLYVLMQGTGIGFSVERQYVSQLPEIRAYDLSRETIYHQVEDSTEGWVVALLKGLETWAVGGTIVFDYNLIRSAGTPLKTKGGYASGPEPLMQLMNFAERILRQAGAEGRKLKTLECHDLACMVGWIVQVGGTRRAAMISLSDPDDLDIAYAKHGMRWFETHPFRTMANNSAVYGAELDSAFDEEFSRLQASGTGERGVFNQQSIIPTRRERRKFGINPCLAPGTLVMTSRGHFPVEMLADKTVNVWDGYQWKQTTFYQTGDNQPILDVRLLDGTCIGVTPYHTMILNDGTKKLASELKAGDVLAASDSPVVNGDIDIKSAYLKGLLMADGSSTHGLPILNLYFPKFVCAERLVASGNEISSPTPVEIKSEMHQGGSRVSVSGLGSRYEELLPFTTSYRLDGLPYESLNWTSHSKCEFLAGMFDGDGNVTDSQTAGFSYQLTSVRMPMLVSIQNLLKTLGITSKIGISRKGGVRDFGEYGGMCSVQDCHRLTINQENSIKFSRLVSFSRLRSFADRTQSYQTCRTKYRTIEIITPRITTHPVYCCNVEDSHQFALTCGILVGNCGEIILRARQLCNLSQAVARPTDTPESLRQKVRIATIFGTLQSCLTRFVFPFSAPLWKQNCEEERLLGVDITGQFDCPLLTPDAGTVRELLLRDLLVEARLVNSRVSALLGINPSKSITCIKPSGNSSQFLNASSGIHPRHSAYYFRRFRFGIHSAMGKYLMVAGVPHVNEGENEVFTFPVKAPEGAPTRGEFTAIEQLENWLCWKQNYVEQSVSCTITVRPDEWDVVREWVRTHWDSIVGLSFLPYDEHHYQNAPYEEITPEQYEAAKQAFPELDFSQLSQYETRDDRNRALDYACLSGACQLA